MDDKLQWKVKEQKNSYHTPVFDVLINKSVSSDGLEGDYYVIKAPEWVTTIPIKDGKFVLVKQYRHGAGELTYEFPGGMVDKAESPEQAAARELEEEIAHCAGKLTPLAVVSPNPALFENHIHIFLAEDLVETNGQKLDYDEYVDYEEVPIEEVIEKYGTGIYTNAFMGTALALYLRYIHVTKQ